jgi:hypothetical protein
MANLITQLYSESFKLLNRAVQWHQLPTWLGVLNIGALRTELREKNLHSTSRGDRQEPLAPRGKSHLWARTTDGSFNDLNDPVMGSTHTRFGRNMPLKRSYPEDATRLLEPNPRLISERLLSRGEEMKPATSLNLLAAAWIQFMTHDWFSHGEPEEHNTIDVPLPPGSTWHEDKMRVRRTARDPKPSPSGPPTFRNEVSHWWDGSQLYGSTEAKAQRVRSFQNGKLTVERDGFLPIDPKTGVEITGLAAGWWTGLSLLHNLFTREHNALCDMLHERYPDWDDARLFDTARLINVALMAKIHTVEWTPGILANPALRIAMDANWWGLAGETAKKLVGRVHALDEISGIPGGDADHHQAEYAMTEEFVSVYRLHPLLPDRIAFRTVKDGHVVLEREMSSLTFKGARVDSDELGFADLLFSLGIANPGRIELHNYPDWMRTLRLPTGETLDLGSIDVLRDRERGVPRYNDFRELLNMPRARRFSDITSNEQWARDLDEVYGDVDRVDLLVGMLAETPPPGFGFSDTAFRVFILMASRRLKSDRFFTRDYRAEVYTQEGLDWVASNDMRTLLLRHCPELRSALRGVQNAFAPWNAPANDA